MACEEIEGVIKPKPRNPIFRIPKGLQIGLGRGQSGHTGWPAERASGRNDTRKVGKVDGYERKAVGYRREGLKVGEIRVIEVYPRAKAEIVGSSGAYSELGKLMAGKDIFREIMSRIK